MLTKFKAKATIHSHASVVNALESAVFNGDLEMVQYLLEIYGQTTEARAALNIAGALSDAASSGELEIVRYLLETYGQTTETRAALDIAGALSDAASSGELEIVQYLLETYGQTTETRAALDIAEALESAALCGELEMVQYLLEAYGQSAEARATLDIAEALVGAAALHGGLKTVQYLVAAYGTDRTIVQAITSIFSMNELENNNNFSEINCLIQAIINSKNHELLVIITQPAILAFFTKQNEVNINEPNLIQTIELLNTATRKALLYDISSHGKSLEEKQKNLKQQQILRHQMALAAADIGKTPQ